VSLSAAGSGPVSAPLPADRGKHSAFAGQSIPDDLLQRTVEIGILSFRPESDLFKSIAVYTDELAFVVNPDHPLAREKGIAIEDLGAESFIAHNVPSPLRRQVVAAFEKHKTPLNMGVELPSLEAVKRFVAMGNGVALVPGLTVGRELASGELVQVPVEALRFERHLRLVHRKRGKPVSCRDCVSQGCARSLERCLMSFARRPL
jgi:DNA-binding transcriptional LysR family regulator